MSPEDLEGLLSSSFYPQWHDPVLSPAPADVTELVTCQVSAKNALSVGRPSEGSVRHGESGSSNALCGDEMDVDESCTTGSEPTNTGTPSRTRSTDYTMPPFLGKAEAAADFPTSVVPTAEHHNRTTNMWAVQILWSFLEFVRLVSQVGKGSRYSMLISPNELKLQQALYESILRFARDWGDWLVVSGPLSATFLPLYSRDLTFPRVLTQVTFDLIRHVSSLSSYSAEHKRAVALTKEFFRGDHQVLHVALNAFAFFERNGSIVAELNWILR